MGLLFINAAYREGSRTKRLADSFLQSFGGDVEEVRIGDREIIMLDKKNLVKYNQAVAIRDFSAPIFDPAKQFSQADEILIAAPFWNYSIPAALHAYLEMVCSQGITFDIGADGQYIGKCNAKRITYVTTAGGYIPENDHAFGYIKTLAENFWHIPKIAYYKADGLDIEGADVDAALKGAFHGL